MIKNSRYNVLNLPMLDNAVRTQFITLCEDSPLILESGQPLGAITIAYETYGTLNTDKNNVVWICHALSGDAHAAFESTDSPHETGWWDKLIGPGKAIDTTRYFVVCSNVLGGCKGSTGPSSINPLTGKPYGLDFPVITIGDMVHAQFLLFQKLGLKQLKMVIGGSMGGMQALEWSILYPSIVKNCVVIASSGGLSPQAIAFDAVGRNAIIQDPKWRDGHYSKEAPPQYGLAIARMIGHITYLSEEAMALKFGRKLQKKEDYGYDFSTDFQVESYLRHQGDKFVHRFDANSYLYLTKAISYFDLGKKYGSLEKAFEHVNAKYLVISISSDWLYPPKQSKNIVKSLMRLNKDVTYFTIDSPYGHDAFLMDCDPLTQSVRLFLGPQ